MTMSLKSSDLFTFVKLVAKLFRSSDVPTICFHPNGGSIKLCAFGKNAMLTMLAPRDGFLDAFAMRLDDLKSVVPKKTGEITFDLQGKNAVQVQSEGVLHRFLTGKNVNDIPYQPSQTSTHSAVRLFKALNDAACCIDRESTAALMGICFRGATSQIVSTTGCQLLVQDGYEFEGWGTSDVVCPASKIFSAKELKEIMTDNVEIGLTNGFLYFGLGSVEIYLKAIDGVFPKVAKIMETAPETTYLTVDPGDADFVLNKLPALPGGKNIDSPVYISLDVAAWLRAYNCEQKTGVALELSRSTFTGKSTSVSINRLFLKNALQFGCNIIGIDPTGDKPVICTGENRTFICVPLAGKEHSKMRCSLLRRSICVICSGQNGKRSLVKWSILNTSPGQRKGGWAGFSGFVRTLCRVLHSVYDAAFE